MSVRHGQDVIYACGHVLRRYVGLAEFNRTNRKFVITHPSPCYRCTLEQQRDAYMRELEVRAAFEQESG